MEPSSLLCIDQELESHEVAALCFLCQDVVNKKDLEKVQGATELFFCISENGLLKDGKFLHELLKTINRFDLLRHLGPVNASSLDSDATPMLSSYRKMLFQIYDDCTKEDLIKMKFLLTNRLSKRVIERCKTALDLFIEMERYSLLSCASVDELRELLSRVDHDLLKPLNNYRVSETPPQTGNRPQLLMDERIETIVNTTQSTPDEIPFSNDAEPSPLRTPLVDAEPSPLRTPPVDLKPQPLLSSPDEPEGTTSLDYEDEYYSLNQMPRGKCVIISNHNFLTLSKRRGTEQDEIALSKLFTELGFTVDMHRDLTARGMINLVKELALIDFSDSDALVVHVLSHGENQLVFGSDDERVYLQELTEPFTSASAPTLAGKPKLFFIQACQGNDFQSGVIPSITKLSKECLIEDDAGVVRLNTVPQHADFLIGMATVPEHRSFRNITTGSIYIQELCKQLRKSAMSSKDDDILTVLTRVNREISKQDYNVHLMIYKQMPEPKYTLTKKLVLKIVR